MTLDAALATGRGIERPCMCPNPEHNASHPTASVNVAKGVWYCYSCHAHGTIDGHVPKIEDILAILAGEDKPRVYPEAWLDMFDADHSSPYWVKRVGYTVAAKNRCGTDPWLGYPTYPMRDPQGRIWGVVHRQDKDPKYLYPAGVSTTQTLFGKIRRADVVILVEGAPDVMALEQAGLPSTWTALGTYGAGLHIPQVELIARCSPKVIIAAFDDDEAGQNANASCEATVDGAAPVVQLSWASAGSKDAADVPTAARLNPINAALRSGGWESLTKEAA
jgi:5S rRNA maturation endonuclease (ribonuclease M5)